MLAQLRGHGGTAFVELAADLSSNAGHDSTCIAPHKCEVLYKSEFYAVLGWLVY